MSNDPPSGTVASGYIEHHLPVNGDVGVAWNKNRVWVCINGVALFRAVLWNGVLKVEFNPPKEGE